MTLRQDILSCSPRGFSRPLSHAEVFQEPLEQRSGAANADVILDDDGCSPKRRGGEVIIVRHPNYVSPGTFAKVEGKLRKATTGSSISGMRWHNPAGHSRTKRHNPSSYAFGPTVTELEHQRREAADAAQAKAIRKLLKRKKPKAAKPSAPATLAEKLELYARIRMHNGPQSQGPRDRPRMSCPELEKRKPRRRKQPPVSPEERAAALALLNTPITVPRVRLAPPKRRRTQAKAPAPITTDTLYSKAIAFAAINTRSAWS